MDGSGRPCLVRLSSPAGQMGHAAATESRRVATVFNIAHDRLAVVSQRVVLFVGDKRCEVKVLTQPGPIDRPDGWMSKYYDMNPLCIVVTVSSVRLSQ
jgi:hypothetical protein